MTKLYKIYIQGVEGHIETICPELMLRVRQDAFNARKHCVVSEVKVA